SALSFGDTPKTRRAMELLKALDLGKTRRVLIVVPAYDAALIKSTRNIPGVELRFAPNFSVRDALTAHKIVLVEEAVGVIADVWSPGVTEAEQELAEVTA
ncbi:MAG TPA: 50S ribosomal protein L4, partial [Chthonomonadaceae bacterium]|nr:50S ribosomal protein L4 [Chthonomonadaceae bacterium]